MKVQEDKLVVCGGCNAKIGPGKLDKILKQLPLPSINLKSSNLLVGFNTSDDAAIIKISEDLAIIQTLDFFPAIVSDPYSFGKIAAANALSDVYAMGGTVLSALNIVAFPENKDVLILSEILKGGAEKVNEAGGFLCGGHSIHDSSPKYGLSVTGTVHPKKFLRNNTCNINDSIILTKPLGVGIITAAYNMGEIDDKSFQNAVASMEMLNKYAAEIIQKYPVSSCTDVTGFGLAGHLNEMLARKHSAVLYSKDIPYFENAYDCAKEFFITAGGQRNRNYLANNIEFSQHNFAIEELIFDPQTSGGLLFSIDNKYVSDILQELNQLKIKSSCIGEIVAKRDKSLIIS